MKKIFISQGDVNGIGNELILKYFGSSVHDKNSAFIIVGCRRIFEETAGIIKRDPGIFTTIGENDMPGLSSPGLYFFDIKDDSTNLDPGRAKADAGKLSGAAIEKAVRLARSNGGALVTCPINKYSLHLGGYNYPGHTEFIAQLLDTREFLMILDGEIIRVALVTTHLPLGQVPAALDTGLIFNKGGILYRSLKNDYEVEKPQITVLSLNPHAGDGGLFGKEEISIIGPAVEKLNREISSGCGKFTGPLPADTAFTPDMMKRTDAYLVMYHDQGLIPLKMLSFGKAVNFTAGLPLIRTSPDHGTAYDIAGKGMADTNSFKCAVEKAVYFLK